MNQERRSEDILGTGDRGDLTTFLFFKETRLFFRVGQKC
jgi:hypothetical protein